MHVLRVTREMDDKVRRAEIEWQTKMLASFIASTVDDQKAREQMVEAAAKLSMVDETSTSETLRPAQADTSGEDTRSTDDVLKHGDIERALARNMRRSGPGIFGMS